MAQAVCNGEDLLIFKAVPQSRWGILAVKLPPSQEQIPLLPQGNKRIKTLIRKSTISTAMSPLALHLSDATCSFLPSLTLSPVFFSPESEVPFRHLCRFRCYLTGNPLFSFCNQSNTVQRSLNCCSRARMCVHVTVEICEGVSSQHRRLSE